LIWTQGTLVAGDLGVSVVGTRKPSPDALQFVRDLVSGLVDHSRTVVSGLAAGVDAEAHRSALAAGGRTVAIIGTGIDVAYPADHRALQGEVAAHGLLLSQFWPGSPPTRKSFPMRNAVMSGYSRVSVIVEAGERSGTRIQARLAVGHGRPVILTQAVARGTTWGAALVDRPGVAVATSAASAVEMAVHLSRPRPIELDSYLALMSA
jgi:DNA processing protein